MKLHRLTVTNYRGIAHRDIEFPDRGVVVVSGANEVGKTSMIEALDLLIESKDRSSKKDVKQVKPTHADVGAEVEAEISCGRYRFVYRKRFHKRPETHLTIVAPRREQLSGDEAHQRVLSMLSESMDMNLWKAQRVLQSTGAGTVDLSASDALTRALDLAAGQSVALSGSEPDLMERMDAEYALYFTPTGRPTGQWARASARLSEAEEALAAAEAAVAEVEQQVCRHDEVTRELAGVIERRAGIARRLEPLEQAAQEVSALTGQRDNARVVAEAAQSAVESSLAKIAERERLAADAETRSAAVAELARSAAAAREVQSAAQEVAVAAEQAAQQATAELTELRAAHDTARDALDRALARDEVDALAARVTRVDLTARQLSAVKDELATATVDSEILAMLQEAAGALAMAEAARRAASAHVEVRALADAEIVGNGEKIALTAGQEWSSAAIGDIEVTVPGAIVARIVPAANTAELRAAVDDARSALDARLARAGVTDLAAARAAHERRVGLVAERDRLTALLDGLLAGEDPNALREKLTRLRELAPEATQLWEAIGPEQARAEVARLAAEVQRAQAADGSHQQASAAAQRLLAQRVTEATVLAGNVALQTDELAAVRHRLAAARAEISDADLAERNSSVAQSADLAARRVEDLAGRLAALRADEVRAELAEARDQAELLDARHEALREELRDIAVRLEVFGRQGRQDQRDLAASEHEYATAEFTRIGARARAVHLLRSVMTRHRDGMRLRYVDPFRVELERLGRLVFGPSFEVDVDSDLTIRSRTLDGRTVPFESLSGGAKEQLGIVARLASAALVAPQDAVPVIIDDALGFTDGERLVKMGEVFGAVGTAAQVIVLTCTPERYRGVADAHRIRLAV